MLQAVNVELKSAEKKKKALDSLLNSGKVSAVSYSRMNEGFMKVINRMKDLKETLEQEGDFWRFNSDEQVRVLERILMSLKFRHMSDEIDAKEWERVKTILTLGLDSMKSAANCDVELPSRPDPPDFFSNEKNGKAQLESSPETGFVSESCVEPTSEVMNLKVLKGKKLESINENYANSRRRKKVNKHFVRSRRKIEGGRNFRVHCGNPWNSECRNTDIELSIYYKGEFLPICHQCWHEISEKNLEWSSV